MNETYTVHTQHGTGTNRTNTFTDWDGALAYAAANTPDTDGSMIPTMDAAYVDTLTGYEKGMFWFGNRYAVITKDGE